MRTQHPTLAATGEGTQKRRPRQFSLSASLPLLRRTIPKRGDNAQPSRDDHQSVAPPTTPQSHPPRGTVLWSLGVANRPRGGRFCTFWSPINDGNPIVVNRHTGRLRHNPRQKWDLKHLPLFANFDRIARLLQPKLVDLSQSVLALNCGDEPHNQQRLNQRNSANSLGSASSGGMSSRGDRATGRWASLSSSVVCPASSWPG
jgi:hypothetical protein